MRVCYLPLFGYPESSASLVTFTFSHLADKAMSKATYKGVYSSFLVLMTTQSALQYSFTFTHLCASISSTLLFYEAQFGVQHLAQGHFGMQICWEDRGSNCRPSGWRTTTLPVSHSRPVSLTCTPPVYLAPPT